MEEDESISVRTPLCSKSAQPVEPFQRVRYQLELYFECLTRSWGF